MPLLSNSTYTDDGSFLYFDFSYGYVFNSMWANRHE